MSHADAPPSATDLAAAKQDYVEGKALHDQGKLDAAVAKFKDSYRLSKNPTLLYNIGFTLDEAGQKVAALAYYRQFLVDAPANAAQRATATDRIKALELEVGTTGTKPAPPTATYGAKDFAHTPIGEAPPGKPLDLTATVPADAGFVVTMYFRAAGDAAFTARPMRVHSGELVARIPAAKMAGSSVQYYIEARDKANALVARSGKSTEPNTINLEARAVAHTFPDFVDDAPVAATGTHNDAENPLHSGPPPQPTSVIGQPRTATVVTGDGLFDVGSTPYAVTKWSATGATVALLAVSIIFYVEAGDAQHTVERDAALSGTQCPSPPCRAFDSSLASTQADGKRDETISRVTLGVGLAAAVVGGYFWGREVFGAHANESATQQARRRHHDGPSWVIAPEVGDGFTGAAAAARF